MLPYPHAFRVRIRPPSPRPARSAPTPLPPPSHRPYRPSKPACTLAPPAQDPGSRTAAGQSLVFGRATPRLSSSAGLSGDNISTVCSMYLALQSASSVDTGPGSCLRLLDPGCWVLDPAVPWNRRVFGVSERRSIEVSDSEPPAPLLPQVPIPIPVTVSVSVSVSVSVPATATDRDPVRVLEARPRGTCQGDGAFQRPTCQRSRARPDLTVPSSTRPSARVLYARIWISGGRAVTSPCTQVVPGE